MPSLMRHFKHYFNEIFLQNMKINNSKKIEYENIKVIVRFQTIKIVISDNPLN